MPEIIFPDGTKLSELLKVGGGTVTGDMTIYKTNPTLNLQASTATSPVLNFKDSSSNIDGQIYTTAAGDMVILASYGGLSIVNNYSTIDINAETVTYLDINDAVKVELDGTTLNLLVNLEPNTTDTYNLGHSSYYWNNAYLKVLYVDDGSTKLDNNTGNMRFTVASGKKFEFVVA